MHGHKGTPTVSAVIPFTARLDDPKETVRALAEALVASRDEDLSLFRMPFVFFQAGTGDNGTKLGELKIVISALEPKTERLVLAELGRRPQPGDITVWAEEIADRPVLLLYRKPETLN